MSRRAGHHHRRDVGGAAEDLDRGSRPTEHPGPYHADPRSPAYIPYCDDGSLYYDPFACTEMIESFGTMLSGDE